MKGGQLSDKVGERRATGVKCGSQRARQTDRQTDRQRGRERVCAVGRKPGRCHLICLCCETEELLGARTSQVRVKDAAVACRTPRNNSNNNK